MKNNYSTQNEKNLQLIRHSRQAVRNSQFYIRNSSASADRSFVILNSQLATRNSMFATLNSKFSTLHSQLSTLNSSLLALALSFFVALSIGTGWSQIYTENFNVGANATITGTSIGTSGWKKVENLTSTNRPRIEQNTSCRINSNRCLIINNTNASCSYDNANDYDVVVYDSAKVNASCHSNIKLTFKWAGSGESSYDYWQIVTCPGASDPTVFANWSVASGSGQYCNNTTTQTVSNFSLPASLDGTYFYIGFRWINDGSVGGTTVAIDDISITGTAIGAPTISVHPSTSTQTQCQNGTAFTAISVTASGTSLSYQWQSSTTAAGTYSNIASATASTYTPSNATAGTLYFKCVVSNCAGSVTSNASGVFTVNAAPANPGNPTSNSPQCASSGVTLTRSGTPPAGETWYWQTSSLGTTTTSSASTYNASTSGTYYIRSRNNTSLCWSSGEGSLSVTVNTVPSQPSAITGTLDPIPGATGQTYSVTNVSGVTYTWSVPSGWSITAGQGTNSITVTVGSTNGNISVTPSNSCGNGTARTSATTIPNYRAQITGASYGASTWSAGESRNVTVTVKNTGISTWTNSSPDVNIGVKWNTNGSNWADYYVRTDANNLASGSTQTYTLTIKATNATSGPTYGTDLSAGTNNLTFDIVNEGNCWFANNTGSCGPGNSVYTTSAITIVLPGENCNNAQDLSTLTSPYSATTVGYADDIAGCRTGYADRIFYIDVPNNSTVTFQESTNSYDEYEYIGYGSNCTSLTQIQCWDNDALAATAWTNTTGATQRVWYVQDAFSGSGTFTLAWSVQAGCSNGDGNTYGNGSWIGYSYNSTSAGGFNVYKGYVTENETFDRDFGTGTPTGVTSNNLCSGINSDLFAIRYKMTKNFSAGAYTFTIGGDDGVRLSIDGGVTWLIDGWSDHGYTTYSSSTFLSGNTNLVLEYYENSGGARVSFSYVFTPAPSNDNCSGATSLTVNAAATTGNVAGASAGSGACTATGNYDVWYSFTASCSANHTINVVGSASFDPVIQVYTSCGGSAINNTSASSCIDATGSGGTETSIYSLTSGVTYYVRVYDYESGTAYPATTTFTIAVTNTPASITSVTGTTPLCSNVTATYTANGVVLGGGTGAWSSSNTSVAGVNASGLVTPAGAGTCNIIYTITGGCGGTVSAQQAITVNATPTISYTGSPYVYCLNNAISNLTPSTSGAITSYGISPALPSGLSFNTSTGVISGNPITSSSATTYTITASGTCSNTTTVSIQTKSGPSNVNAGYDVALCSGNSVQFSGSAVSPTVLYNSDFSSLTGWTTNDGNRWYAGETNYAGGTSSEATFQWYSGSNPTTIDANLQSPLIPAAGWTNLTMSFKHMVDWYTGTVGPLTVESSTNGTTWTQRWALSPTADVAATTVSNIDLSALNGQSFYIRFRHNGNIWNLNDWYIDDITISGTSQVTYSWSPSTFLSATNVANPTASSVTSAQTYTMTATTNGCSVTDQVDVSIRTIPAATASNSGAVCAGTTVNLIASNMAPSARIAEFSGTQTTSGGALTSVSNTFTMEMWVNPTATRPSTSQATSGTDGVSNQRYAINPAHSGTNGGAGISVGTNGVSVFEHGDGYLPSLLVHDVTISGWTHIAVVYNNKQPTLYINGNLVKVGLTSTKPSVFPSVGTSSSYGYYSGSIDNVRIWNTARSATQILSNMNLSTPTSSSGLVAHYNFDNDNINDVVGSNNLTNSGATFSTPTVYTYTWSGTSAPAAGTSETQTTGALTNATSSATTSNYNVTATAGGCSGTASSNTTVTINPKPSIANVSTTICSGSAFTVTPTNGGGASSNDVVPSGTTYTWTISSNSNITGQSAQATGQSSISQTLTNTTSSNQVITYTVTPTSPTTPNCAGSTFTITVTVNSTFSAGAVNTTGETFCSGGNPVNITSSTAANGGDGSITYKWQANGVDISNSNNLSYDPPSGLSSTTTYTRWAKDGACNITFSQSTGSWVVTVNQPSNNISVVNGVNIGNGDYLWNGNISSDGSVASNWYVLNNGVYSVASSAPTNTTNIYVVPFTTASQCISSSTFPNNPSAGTFESKSVYIGSGAQLTIANGSNYIVKGDFVNNGAFTSNTGTVNMNGSTAQSIGGSAATTFNNLIINNSNGVSLNVADVINSPIVNGTLTLTNGRLSLGSNNLTLGTSATISGTPSASNMIVAAGSGELRKRFSSAVSDQPSFTFPVGTVAGGNEYTPVVLDFNSGTFGASAYVSVKLEDSKNSSMNNVVANYINRNWIVEPSNITNYNYEIKLYYTDADVVTTNLQEGSIKPVKISSGQWYQPDDLEATFVNAVKQGSGFIYPNSNYMVWGGLVSFSEFGGAGGDNVPLPVELVSFSGACEDGVISLTWQTASEHNSSHFDVEKSRDGENWQLLSTLPSAGTSNELITYQSSDQNGLEGNNYFRLRQVDVDGKEKLYDPINVSCSEVTTGYFSSFPNPSGNTFQIIVNNKDLLGNCTLNMVDASGKVIEQRDIEVKDGINMFVINQELTPGIYFLNISNGSKSTPVIRHAIK